MVPIVSAPTATHRQPNLVLGLSSPYHAGMIGELMTLWVTMKRHHFSSWIEVMWSGVAPRWLTRTMFRVNDIEVFLLLCLLLIVSISSQTIRIQQLCVSHESPISVSFTNATAVDDWVGLVLLQNLGDSMDVLAETSVADWVWTCGNQPCFRRKGSVMLPPVALGLYKVVLAANAEGSNYPILAVSENVVSVSNTCASLQGVAPRTVAELRVSSSVGRSDEPIEVSFINHEDALPDDFVALYPLNDSLGENGLLWKYLCNRQEAPCGTPLRSGVVEMDASGVWVDDTSSTSNWPLREGWYRAYLMRNMYVGESWVVVAESKKFFVESQHLGASWDPELNSRALLSIQRARHAIHNLILDDIGNAAKFLRLIFHDCIGGCDGTEPQKNGKLTYPHLALFVFAGCVDLSNPENRGLEGPIDLLEPIFQEHAASISRADIWALAATVGVDVTQDPHHWIQFPFQSWGRVDCTERVDCQNEEGSPVPCSPKHGPHHEHPTIHMNTADLYHFFLAEFGFNTREAIVAMGAHTIGTLSPAVRAPNFLLEYHSNIEFLKELRYRWSQWLGHH